MKRLLLALVLAGCSSKEPAAIKESPCKESAGPFAPLSTRCGQLVDAQGRVVFLRGINARVGGIFDVDLGPGKTPLLPPLPVVNGDDLARMRAIGFDTLRLPIHWSALEPEAKEPPLFDATYMQKIADFVALAKQADVKVLLDLHQDAWSKWIGEDGAPLWAIVPAPEKTLEGPLTDLGARVTSAAVQKAFTTFFDVGNADGKRLRAHYAAMVQALATEFRGDSTVVGIDLFNEPLASDANLRAFHEETIAALRRGDPARLAFFEPTASRNLFDSATIPDAPLSAPGVVYAPHVYTKVFTTGCDETCRNDFTIDTLRPSNESARAEADGWKAPLVVGEFGFGQGSKRYVDYVSMQLALQDEVLASSFFWVWKENGEGAWGFFDWNATTGTWTERPVARAPFARVQARAVAGFPESMRWDAAAKRFELAFVGDANVTAPTLVHTPLAADVATKWRASCDGTPVASSPDAKGDLAIACGGPGEHHIVVEASP